MPQLPWNALARGLVAATHDDASRPTDRGAALAAVAPLADGIAMVEAALFDTPTAAGAHRAVAVHLLCERIRIGLAAADGGRVPLSLLARHGITGSTLAQPQGAPAVSDWAAELAAALPSDMGNAVLYRRTRAAFDRWFLQERVTGRERRMPSLQMLRLAWSSARQGRKP
jgi:hypothetical protein